MISGDEYFALSGGSGMGASLWDEQQTEDALSWVEDGGTLVLFDTGGSVLSEELGLEVSEHKKQDARLRPAQPAPYLEGVDEVYLPGKHRWTKKPAGALTLFGDDKPAVVAVRRGKGRVLAFSSSAVIDNTNLAKADNARLLVEVARTFGAQGQPVLFDEYHQGFQEATSFWTAVGRPGQLAFYQLLALLLLVCYSAGVRFGLPRPLPEGSRVSSEYVASLANLYRRARAADAALESVYLSFWRDLCRASGLPLDTDTPEVARRAAATLGDTKLTTAGAASRRSLEQRLDSLLHRAEAGIEAGPKKFKDRDLLALVRELEEMRKELGLGRDDDNAAR